MPKRGSRSRARSPSSRRGWAHLESPEFVIGLVAGVGAPLDRVQDVLKSELMTLGYRSEVLHLSKLTSLFPRVTTPHPSASATEYDRIEALMNRGDEARAICNRNDILALAAIGVIRKKRGASSAPLSRRAFVLRQLKRPEEVFLLRQTYGDGFLLVGAHASNSIREAELRQRGVSASEAYRLIDRDEHEASDSGQQLRDTFHLADVFVDATDERTRREGLRRFLEVLFGLGIRTPSHDEFGMFQAFASSLRSAQLGRQVGAAIMSQSGELLAVGTNEVPKYGGGSYWDDDPSDQRDHQKLEDSSDKVRKEMVWEIVERITPGWESLRTQDRLRTFETAFASLRSTTVAHLTEFGRAVHAEAEAIVSAARRGVSIRGGRLYCTTFPCHVCAKHIVGAGIQEVVYVEPYPKSKALKLHDDSIVLEEPKADRVLFRPFVGIAPRRYAEFFSMRSKDGREIRRKDDSGRPIRDEKHLRLRMPYLSALEREAFAALELDARTRRS